MKLDLPDLMDHIEKREIMIATSWGMPEITKPKDKVRQKVTLPLIAYMHKAQKFIFDSGSDQDADTVNAVKDTAVAMIEAGLFHLPYPVTWIEDPFEDNPALRNYYLCVEKDDMVTVYLFQKIPPIPDAPHYLFHLHPMEISLKEATDLFTLAGAWEKPNPVAEKTFGEAVYSLKKFLVCLETENIIREKVEGSPFKAGLPKKHRKYEHSIIRIPTDVTEASGGQGTGTGAKRRRHLVRGYIWGRNTREADQQRWIKPFWRGSKEVIETRSHYELKA